jgi:putative ABC transport system substrate-binding protein
MVIISAPDFSRDAALLSRLALEAGLPTVCEWASMARDGCLIGYGPNFADLWRRPADYVTRILRRRTARPLFICSPGRYHPWKGEARIHRGRLKI